MVILIFKILIQHLEIFYAENEHTYVRKENICQSNNHTQIILLLMFLRETTIKLNYLNGNMSNFHVLNFEKIFIKQLRK